MAHSVITQLQIIYPDGRIMWQTLPDHALIRLGQHPDNDIVLPWPGIAPFHAELTITAEGVELHALHPLTLGGGPVVAQQMRPWAAQQMAQLGPIRLVLLHREAAPEVYGPPFSVRGPNPAKQRMGWFHPSGHVRFSITNHLPYPAQFRVQGHDQAGRCTFALQPHGAAAPVLTRLDFAVAAQQTVIIRVEIKPQQRAIFSMAPRRHHFALTAHCLSAELPPRTVNGQLLEYPIISGGSLSLLLILLLPVLSLLFQPSGSLEAPFSAAPKREVITWRSHDEPDNADLLQWRQHIIERNAAEVVARFYGQPYQKLFEDIAPVSGLSWQLLAEIAYRESRFNPRALGKDDHLGLMQLPPSVWQASKEQLGLVDPYEPHGNLLVAADYLAQLRRLCEAAGYRGEHWVLAAYRLGEERMAELFAAEGSWGQLPMRERRYALDVLHAVTASPAGLGRLNSRQAVTYQPPEIDMTVRDWWFWAGERLEISPLSVAYHQIAVGDTVSNVAAMYGVSPVVLLNEPHNSLASAQVDLQLGQWLLVPGAVLRSSYSSNVSVELPKDALMGSGRFAWPVRGSITQGYRLGHPALDIRGRSGTLVQAADAGHVVQAGWDGPYGNAVRINHGNGFITLYAHMASYEVQTGGNVVQGQAIGTVGSTGNSTGPHLHFEIKQGSSRHNPRSFLP